MRLKAHARGVVAAVALGANTLAMSLAMVPFALAKLLLRRPRVRTTCDRILNKLAQRWVAHNGAWLGLGERLEATGIEGLERRGWYVVTCNHQGWADIFVLQHAFHRRIPLLKFFLKRELIYVPVIGLAWWALDFPFMRRQGGGRASRDDLAAAQASCMRFRATPTTLLNFVEGTRYTPEKAARQRSPYRHLLKPKSGGMTVALGALGDKLDGVLDVTIVYPDGVPTFWQLLSGRMGRVILKAHRASLPQSLAQGGFAPTGEMRQRVQDWLNDLWLDKDATIAKLSHSVVVRA